MIYEVCDRHKNDFFILKILMETGICISRTICCDQKFRTIKIWCTCWNKLNLYRPLHKFTCVSVKAVETVVIGACVIAVINMSRIFTVAVP